MSGRILAFVLVATLVAMACGQGPPPTTSPGPSPADSPGQGLEPPIVGSWQLTVPLFQDRSLRLEVADQSGRLLGARAVDRFPDGPARQPDDPFALDIRRVPGNTHEVFVGWIAGGCDYRGRLLLDRPGANLTLQFAPKPGCDAVGIGQGVILEFGLDVDANAISGRELREPLVSLDQFTPSAIAFADRNVGWIGGTTADADALVLHTVDGGATWTTSGLGEGGVAELTVIDARHAFATGECFEHQFECRPGTLRWDEDFGGWGLMTSERFVRMHFAGDLGIAVVLPDSATAPIIPELRLTEGAGNTWSAIADPCPAEMNLANADRTSPASLLVLCLAEGGTGGSFKLLLASNDGGVTWIERSSTNARSMSISGSVSGFDVAADGSGWMWGSRMPLIHTADAGASWSELDVADGDVRIVNDASYLGAGSGFVIVQDPDRQAILLLWTRDGQTWDELGTWPLQ